MSEERERKRETEGGMVEEVWWVKKSEGNGRKMGRNRGDRWMVEEHAERE